MVEPGSASNADSVAAILHSLTRVIGAERESRQRTGRAIGVNDADLVAIGILVESRDRGVSMSATDLARAIGISSASTTALIDRLEAREMVRRAPHHTDRRIVIVEPTVDDSSEVQSALGRSQAGMTGVASRFSPSQAEVVSRFLDSMSEMYDGIHSEAR